MNKAHSRVYMLVGLVVILAFLLGACSQPAPASTSPPKATSTAPAPTATAAVAPIVLGDAADFTGTGAGYCTSLKQGEDLAAEEINAAGGIKSLNGAKIQMVHLDHQFLPEVAKQQAERLVNDYKVHGLILGIPSGFGVTIGQIANSAGVAYWPAMAITSGMLNVGLNTMARISLTGSQIGYHSIKYVDFLTSNYLNKKPVNIGVLYCDVEYPKDVLKGIKDQAAKSGYTVMAEVSYPLTLTDASSYILKMKAANPDILFIVPQGGEGPLIDKTMIQLGYNPLMIGVAGSQADNAFLQNMGSAGENTMVMNYVGPGISPAAVKFFDSFQKKYNVTPDGFGAFGYQLVYCFAAAVQNAGSYDRAAIVKASRELQYTEKTGPLVLNYSKIAFDDQGQQLLDSSGFVGLQVQNGKYATIMPKVADTTFKFKDSWASWKK